MPTTNGVAFKPFRYGDAIYGDVHRNDDMAVDMATPPEDADKDAPRVRYPIEKRPILDTKARRGIFIGVPTAYGCKSLVPESLFTL